MAKMTGGEALAQTLKAAGVEYIFGISVGSQAPLTLGAMRLGMKIVTVRDEKCAALMATAYSKISGKPGICLASSPGAAHLALGMYEAFNSANAMLAITAMPPWPACGGPAARIWISRRCSSPSPSGRCVPKRWRRFPTSSDRALRVATTGNPGPVAVIVSNSLICGGGGFRTSRRKLRPAHASGVPCRPWGRIRGAGGASAPGSQKTCDHRWWRGDAVPGGPGA